MWDGNAEFFLNSFLFNRIFISEAEGTTELEQLQSEFEEKGMEEGVDGHIHSYNTYHANSKKSLWEGIHLI